MTKRVKIECTEGKAENAILVMQENGDVEHMETGNSCEMDVCPGMAVLVMEAGEDIGFGFGVALHALKAGNRVAREGWNGKDMFLFLVPGSIFEVNRPPLLGIYPEGTKIEYHSHIDMRTADGKIVPWLASQTDLISEDWQILNI